MRPCATKDILTSCEVDKVNRGRMEVDVEAVFDPPEDCVFVYVMVAGIHDAEGAGPAFLSCADSGPKDSFSTSAGVAAPLAVAHC